MKFSWHIIGYGLATLVLAGLALAYEGAQRDKIRSDAVQAAQATYQKQLEQMSAAFDKKIADNAAATQATLKQMADSFAKIQKAPPQQQIQWSQSELAERLKGIEITLDAQGNAIAKIPAATIPQLPVTIEQCKECNTKLVAAQTDLADRQAQMALAQKQIESLQTQRDAAVKANKGGSWTRRAVTRGKHFLIDGGITIAIVCGLGHCKL